MTDPLVMVPGIGTDAQAWDGMPDGLILSSGADTIEGMAGDILARCPPRFALAGHSMGGYIALAMIGKAPERVSRLALISTAAAPDTPEQREARMQLMASAKADFEAVVEMLCRAMLSRKSRENAQLVADTAVMIRRCGLAAFLREQGAVLERPDLRPLLAKIDVPTLILSGEDDRVISSQRSVELAEAIKGAALVSIPNCGHCPQQEATAQVRAALLQWLGDGVSA